MTSTILVNPHGIEMEVLEASIPALLKKGFTTKETHLHRESVGESTELSPYIFVRNPKGLIVEVDRSRLTDLQKIGYEIVEATRYEILGNTGNNQVNWDLPSTPSYRFDGYGRLVSYITSYFSPGVDAKVHLICGQPREIERIEGHTYVLLTMFEADRIPQEWVKFANTLFDYIIVPAQFSEDVFKKCGVITPIVQIPLFATHFEIYEPPTDVFTFTHQNALVDGSQKGWDLVIRAFMQLFKDREDVRLILKARNHDWAHSRYYEDWIAREKNIELLQGDWIYQDIHSRFYARTNCFVYPSRGEGWGLPPLEAMAHGIPTILTKAHSHTEFSEYGIEIGTTGESFSYYIDRVFEAGIGHWAEPNFDELLEAMQMVVDDYIKQKARAVKNAAIIEKKFNAKLFTDRLQKFMGDVCEK